MRRRLIFAIVGLVLLVGIGIGIFLLVRQSPTLQNAVLKAANKPVNSTTLPSTNINVPKVTDTPDRQATVFVARNFAELYGSYSNQNKGSNLLAAKAYATASYATDLQAQATAVLASPPAKEYSGTITKALVFTNIKLTPPIAQVLVSTSQKITTGTTTKTQNKDLLVDLQKVGNDWKVNAAVWK